MRLVKLKALDGFFSLLVPKDKLLPDGGHFLFVSGSIAREVVDRLPDRERHGVVTLH